MKKWIKERDNSTNIIWRNTKDSGITIEGHYDRTLNLWLVYGAIDGKGIPNNPLEPISKKDAIHDISLLKQKYNKKGIIGLSEW